MSKNNEEILADIFTSETDPPPPYGSDSPESSLRNLSSQKMKEALEQYRTAYKDTVSPKPSSGSGMGD